jgi:hypothetical protein
VFVIIVLRIFQNSMVASLYSIRRQTVVVASWVDDKKLSLVFASLLPWGIIIIMRRKVEQIFYQIMCTFRKILVSPARSLWCTYYVKSENLKSK